MFKTLKRALRPAAAPATRGNGNGHGIAPLAEPGAEDPLAILRAHPLFSCLPKSALAALAGAARLRAADKGEEICRQGAGCETLFLVVRGRCRAAQIAVHGTRPAVSILGPGEVIGQHELVCGGGYQATVTVATDAALLEVPAAAVGDLLPHHARLAARLAFGTSVGARKRPHLPRRAATLVSAGLPLADLPERIAARIAAETGSPVLLVRLHGDNGVTGRAQGAPSLAQWAETRAKLNGKFAFTGALEAHADGWSVLDIETAAAGAGGSRAVAAEFLSHANQFFPFVLVAASACLPGEGCADFLAQSDLGFIYAEDAGALRRPGLIAAAQARAHLVLPAGSGGDPTPRSADLQHPPLFLDQSAPDRVAAHVRYVARTVARRRIGLALSSGSAKGLAHIGIIEVLEENGVEVDVVAGTSMGAYVGACWCKGNAAPRLRELAAEIVGRAGVFRLVDPIFPPRVGFLRGEKIRERLRKSIDDAAFSDLARPLHVVATDLNTLERAVFSRGKVAETVHASLAMPGVCAPVALGGVRYTDGAASSPLPVDVLEEMGVERIIAVSVLPSLADLARLEQERGDPPAAGGWRQLGRWLHRQVNYFARGNILDTVMRGLQAGQVRLAEAAGRRADVFIHAYPFGSRWYEFDGHDRIIAEGRAAAEGKLDELRALATVPPVPPSDADANANANAEAEAKANATTA